jgi:2-polyprenyl-3-methyl-5-hydroxy-6-metoxy-1,4-benzoquinol methylase
MLASTPAASPTSPPMSPPAPPATAADFSARLVTAKLGFVDVLAMFLGDRLGWYRALTEHGPASAAELVARAGGTRRYAQEWLEQQAASGILTVEADGRFGLPPAAAEVLTDVDSLFYDAHSLRMLLAVAAQMPALVEAYRSGGGVGWADFGADMRTGQADSNRAAYLGGLGRILAGLPDIDSVLRRPGARIADVGCGAGWSTIALARAYPESTVDGLDFDGPSVAMARQHAAAAGLGDRVTFTATDAADLAESAYDAAFAFECLHDLPHPVPVLAAMRRAVRPGGVVVIMDQAVADAFALPMSDRERMSYGYSILVCLPGAMTTQPTAATGTVMRPDTLRRYARQAGFADIEVLPAPELGTCRFYRLVDGG